MEKKHLLYLICLAFALLYVISLLPSPDLAQNPTALGETELTFCEHNKFFNRSDVDTLLLVSEFDYLRGGKKLNSGEAVVQGWTIRVLNEDGEKVPLFSGDYVCDTIFSGKEKIRICEK